MRNSTAVADTHHASALPALIEAQHAAQPQRSSRSRGVRLRWLAGALAASTAISSIAGSGVTFAQTASAVGSLDIPAQSLADALVSFSRQTRIQIFVSSDLAAGKRSPAVSGSMAPEAALRRLLTGTGLTYSFTNPTTVTISGRGAASAPVPDDGSLVLNVIDVTAGRGETSVYTPYETAGATAHISAQDIERFRGSSPADIFRGTPGVLSGDARNSAGAIDVNIRGLQGQGRVKVSIDDAENAVTVYQGYQGQSNRTYIDPDFIGGIDINKGLDVASRGAAGSVSMRTINAGDIVKEGDSWGLRVRGGFGTNTISPTPGNQGGYSFPVNGTPIASENGLDRPSFLQPTSGSGSITAAIKQDDWDFLAGYAYRKQGNYFAGTNGGDGVWATPALVESTGRYTNIGLTNYRPGEEVLNTQLQTQSWLAKANIRFDHDQSLQFTYNGYRGESGNWLPNVNLLSGVAQADYGATTGIKLDTGTMRYRWNPEDDDLIDLKANAWVTYFQFLNDARLSSRQGDVGTTIWPTDIGLYDGYRTGTNTTMWGAELSNRSKFAFDTWGEIDLTYGVSYMGQDVKLTPYHEFMSLVPPSQGTRDEYGAYGKLAWKPQDWVTLNAGLRYSGYQADGPTQTYQAASGEYIETGPAKDAAGFSPSAGVTVEPFEGTQFYANYASALRLPSLMETIGTFTIVEPGLTPERLNSWDLGVNVLRENVLADNDRAMLKFGWFDWNVDNYISRALQPIDQGSALRIHNIAGAKFSGFELSSRYERGGFTANLSADYYTNVQFCETSDTCGNSTQYGDYATNHVPPEYTVDLTLTQKLLEDRLTIGGRAYYVGPRAAEHGAVTAQGASAFIAQVQWKPYTLIDVFAEYKINDNFTASVRVENLTDQYYVDPLGLLQQPGPGRTFYASLTGTIGGDQPIPTLAPSLRDPNGSVDWSGLYVGAQGSLLQAYVDGTTRVLDPNASDFGGKAAAIAASESANLDLSGGRLGVQAGYNMQFANRIVAGVEMDLGKTWSSATQDTLAIDDDAVAANGWRQSRLRQDIDWTSSLRGRLGYAFDNGLMLYGTAGLAVLGETVTRDQFKVTGQISTNPGGTGSTVTWADKQSGTRIGATAGLGGEYALNDRWSLKAEYAFSGFGSKDYDFANARAGAGSDYSTREVIGTNPLGQPIYKTTNHEGGYKTVNGRQSTNSFDLHSIKIGLNYRF